MKVWTSSSKQQEAHPEPTKTKEEINLEQMKEKVKRSALEKYDFVLQEQLKSLMYVDHSLRGEPKKDKLIDELIFKIACVKEKHNNQFICCYYIQKNKVYYSSIIFCCQQYLLISIYSEYET